MCAGDSRKTTSIIISLEPYTHTQVKNALPTHAPQHELCNKVCVGGNIGAVIGEIYRTYETMPSVS